MKRKHYYSFAFSHSNGNMVTTASVYIGYPKKFVSIPQIRDAKEGAGIHPEAIMLSCCYLGKLTREEMDTGITRRSTLTGKAGRIWSKLKLLVRFPGK